MRLPALCLMLAAAAPAIAQDAPAPRRTIQVTGNGRVSTMPTIAMLHYWIVGEGATSDEASSALVARQQAIEQGLAGLLGPRSMMTNSDLVLIAVRGPQCDNANNYNAPPRLSEGACAIIGYQATAQGSIRTEAIAKAGTAVGLASRLGARDARIDNFVLDDERAARRAAIADAIADAKQQAAALAGAAGEKLGPILAIRDQNAAYGEIVAQDVGSAPPPPPPPAPRAPVEIAVKPRPIETTAQVYVTFAIAP